MTITNSTHTQHKSSRGSSTQTRKISVLDGWMNLALRFFSFFFCSLFFWWYDEPKFVWDWTLLYPSSIGYYYTFILSLFSSLLSAGGMSPSRIIHIHELTYKCRSLYEKKDLLVYTHTQLLLYSTHYIALSFSLSSPPFFGGWSFAYAKVVEFFFRICKKRFFLLFLFVWTRITFFS